MAFCCFLALSLKKYYRCGHVLGNKKEAVAETEELKMDLRKGFTIYFTAVILL